MHRILAREKDIRSDQGNGFREPIGADIALRVTLDTNIFGPVTDLAAYSNCPDGTSCAQIRQALENGKLKAYVSEASLSLEALSHKQRIDEFFREWATKTTGILLPTPHHKRLQIIETILALGVKVLHVPRLALGTFAEISETAWAQDDIYPIEKRQKRHSEFVLSFPDKGPKGLKTLGASLVQTHRLDTLSVFQFPGWPPPEELIWIKGIVAEFDSPKQFPNQDRFISHVRELIAEWSDLDILASHYAYGIERFCTFDEGRKAGPNAILNASNWNNLESRFGIKIVSPMVLLAELK